MKYVATRAPIIFAGCVMGLLVLSSISMPASAQAIDRESQKMTVDTGDPSPLDLDGVFAEQNKGGISEGFTLRAELKQSVVAPGQPVTLSLSLLNCSSATLLSAEPYPDPAYLLDVRNAKGERLSRIVEKDQFGYVWPSTNEGCIVFPVAPGESRAREYVVKAYDMSEPGVYQITVAQGVFRLDGEGGAHVVSNTALLTVAANPQVIRAASVGSVPSKNGRIIRPRGADAHPRLIEVRTVLERHGCRLRWYPASAEAAVSAANGTRAAITANSNILVLDGKKVRMWSAAKVVNGQLQAPGDAVSQITARCGR